MELRVLKRRLEIGKRIDDFLDNVSESGLLFKLGVDSFLKGNFESFGKKLEDITQTEKQGDSLRRSLEEQLYVRTLIPESRGDVLELLENMDALLNRFKGAMWRFEIEYPVIPAELHNDVKELVACVVEAVEAMVRSARAFFKDIAAVADHMHKVSYWEKQSDKVSTQLQRNIFRQEDLRLSHKLQLRDFVIHIDHIADQAEDVADQMSIYVIKRSL
jgi:predicted phosphate transport protein (TIGR00153 family)